MVKVYDMASGELLTGSALASQHVAQHQAGAAWTAPGAMSEFDVGIADEAAMRSHRHYRDVPELALQLIPAC